MSSLHYNGSNSNLFFNAVKMHRFKAKESEIKPDPLCLGKIFSVKYFEILPRHNEYEKRELKGSVKVFFIDYDAINTSNILDNSYSIA